MGWLRLKRGQTSEEQTTLASQLHVDVTREVSYATIWACMAREAQGAKVAVAIYFGRNEDVLGLGDTDKRLCRRQR